MSREDGYGLDELMVVEASRHVSDWDIVMVGTGMPVVASLLALKNHAPNMCFVVETGSDSAGGDTDAVVDRRFPGDVPFGEERLSDRLAGWRAPTGPCGHRLHRRRADRPVRQRQLHGDRRLRPRRRVRFPGSGGANDIASHAKKVLIIARHELRRFPANCDFITSPGYIDGPDGRKNAGLTSPYPDIFVFTDLAVMAIDKSTGRLKIDKLMPGVTIDLVREHTGFEPIVSGTPPTVEPPSARELRILREQVDPTGVYLKAEE